MAVQTVSPSLSLSLFALQSMAKVVRAKCVRHCLGVPASVSASLAAFGVDATSAAAATAASSCLIAKQPKLKCNQSFFFFCLKSKSFAYSRAGRQGKGGGGKGRPAAGGCWLMLKQKLSSGRKNASATTAVAQTESCLALGFFFCCCSSRNVCGSWPFPLVFLPMP